MRRAVHDAAFCIVEFAYIYIPLHLLYFYKNIGYSFFVMILASSLLGVSESALLWKIHKKKTSNSMLFCVVFLLLLGISAMLFSGAPYQGLLARVYSCFPQLIIITYMIPGVVCHLFLDNICWLKNRIRK